MKVNKHVSCLGSYEGTVTSKVKYYCPTLIASFENSENMLSCIITPQLHKCTNVWTVQEKIIWCLILNYYFQLKVLMSRTQANKRIPYKQKLPGESK